MSSKIRLDDLSTEAFDDMDNDFFKSPEPGRQKKVGRKHRKRQMIEDYMEERSLKRRITDSYEFF